MELRFGEEMPDCSHLADLDLLTTMAGHQSRREFRDEMVSNEMVRLLSAIALSSPTKSDLQQRDIIVIKDKDTKAKLTDLTREQSWIGNAPLVLVFCGNNRRQRKLHEWQNHEFANDHLDAFFNAAVDAGIALSAFVVAAEATGLATCPISAVRNRATEVSDLLALPDHVFPVAGLALGYPKSTKQEISLRLPLSLTLHCDRYQEENLEGDIEQYNQRRADIQPYKTQRLSDELDAVENYCWAEDKARQYSKVERGDFGKFVENKGFKLT